ncbi:glycosyltransferase family 4 protein [Parasaccharibacter apium]|nr:glycosyltransferase family 1 protein [Parasaccharibacter apium]
MLDNRIQTYMSSHSSNSYHKSLPEIWFDGRNIGRQQGTGVHHYAINHNNILKEIGFDTAWLLENIENVPPQNSLLRLVKALFSKSPNISNRIKSDWGDAYLAHDLYRIAHVHYRYHKNLLRLNPKSPPEIMHWTYPLPLLMEGCRNIVTIHDLIPLTHPHLTRINPIRFSKLIKDLIENSVHFLTVSETVRQQMISLFSLPENRIETLYQPVEFDEKIRNSIKNAPQIAPENSFLFYGRVENRKNINRLLEAHALSGTKTPLIIIGPDGDDRPNCTPRSPSSRIIRLPWSNRLSLLRTLKEAKGLLFPSLAEGFGLPIIEAMSLGVPVLTSRGGATEEIAGNAALLCNATDTANLASTIAQLDSLPLAHRTSIIKYGRERATFFSKESYKKRIYSMRGYF